MGAATVFSEAVQMEVIRNLSSFSLHEVVEEFDPLPKVNEEEVQSFKDLLICKVFSGNNQRKEELASDLQKIWNLNGALHVQSVGVNSGIFNIVVPQSDLKGFIMMNSHQLLKGHTMDFKPWRKDMQGKNMDFGPISFWV